MGSVFDRILQDGELLMVSKITSKMSVTTVAGIVTPHRTVSIVCARRARSSES